VGPHSVVVGGANAVSERRKRLRLADAVGSIGRFTSRPWVTSLAGSSSINSSPPAAIRPGTGELAEFKIFRELLPKLVFSLQVLVRKAATQGTFCPAR